MADTPDRRSLLRAFFDEQRMGRRLEQVKAKAPQFRSEYDRRTEELVGSGQSRAFTHRRVIMEWATDPEPPTVVSEAAGLAVATNGVISRVGTVWPQRSVVGRAGTFAAAALLAHADDAPDLRDRLLGPFEQAAESREADPRHFVHVADRHFAVEEGTQRYGSLMVPDASGDPMLLVPLIDETNADELRAQLGLGTVAESRRAWGRLARPGPFLIPHRPRDWLMLATTLSWGALLSR